VTEGNDQAPWHSRELPTTGKVHHPTQRIPVRRGMTCVLLKASWKTSGSRCAVIMSVSRRTKPCVRSICSCAEITAGELLNKAVLMADQTSEMRHKPGISVRILETDRPTADEQSRNRESVSTASPNRFV
jgi:hypothetical protein